MAELSMRGFSLIEFTLVISIIGLIAISMFPMSAAMYQAQILSELRGSIVASLRVAQTDAKTRKEDSNYGVKILENSYVLFSGSSFETRNQTLDYIVNFTDTVTHQGLSEVVFLSGTGLPTATGTLTLSFINESATITIADNGLVK